MLPRLGLIALAALLLRLALLVLFHGYEIAGEWHFGYETGRIARALASGQGFSSPFRQPSGPTAWMMPAYPALLALVFRLFGIYSRASAVAILALNSVASALTCIPLFYLARRAFGSPTAWLATVAFALYPPAIWHSINTIWDTSLLALVCVVLALLFHRVASRPGLGELAAYGAALGLGAWLNPVVLSLLPFVWWWILVRSGRPLGWKARAAAVVPAAIVVVLSPWLVRNIRQFDRPLLRSNLGLELRLGNSQAAWEDYLGGLHTAPWFLGHPSEVPEEFERFVEMGELRYTQQALAEALDFIRDNPGKFLRLSARRIGFFWLSDLGEANEWAGNLKVRFSLSSARVACHLLPLPFLLLGLWAALRQRLVVGPLLAFMLLLPPTYYLTHVSERYRFPIEPFILLFASYGAIRLLGAIAGRYSTRDPAMAGGGSSE